ncbi:MAG: oligosaccharide flippase family protein [Dehalococcoidia bacterium]
MTSFPRHAVALVKASLQQGRHSTMLSMFSGISSGFGGQAALLVSGVFAARILGVEGRGQLALFALFPTLLVQLGGLGLPSAATYYIAQEPARARGIVQQLAFICFLQCVVLTVANAGLLFLVLKSEGGLVLEAAVIASLSVAPILLQTYGLAILQGAGRFHSLHILRLVSPALYAAGVVVLFATGAGNLQSVAIVWAIANSVMALLIGYAVQRTLRAYEPIAAPGTRTMFAFGTRSIIGASSMVDTLKLDQAMAGLLLSPATLGLYVAGTAFSNLPRILAVSIGVVAYPKVAGAENPRSARRTMWVFFAVTMALCGLMVLGLELIVGRLIPLFFGQEFAGAISVARILLVGTLFVSGRRILSDCARGAGLPGLSSVAELVSWVALVPAIAVLMPLWGVDGIALALTLASATAFITLLVLTLRALTDHADASTTTSLEMAA